jgi:hypothetical protein
MKTHRFTVAQAVASFLLVFGIPCVILGASARRADALSIKQRDEIVEKIAQLLEGNYVYPEIGKTVSGQLLENHQQGKYSQAISSRDLADHLSADLAAWTNDKHLNVVYDPDWVREMKEANQDDAYLTKEMIAEERARNFGFKRLEILDGNVGYLDLRIFFHPKYAGQTAVAAMNLLSDCEAVIVDLRNNGGGWGDMVSFLSSYFLDNEETIHLNSVYSRPEDRYYQSWTSPYVPGRIMANIPLYILTSRSTFSAAEEFCYNLKFLKRSTIVGERTRGGAHPISSRVLTDELILIMPECASIHPVTKGNWEGVGVEPDIEVAAEDAFNVAYLNALEKLRGLTQNEEQRAIYQWFADGFRARLSPVEVNVEILESYVGRYGTLNITFEDSILMYQRGDRAKYKMIPMSETLFLVDEQSSIRIKFKKEKDQTIGVIVLYGDGNSVEYKREVE